jgi:hypothetical protein
VQDYEQSGSIIGITTKLMSTLMVLRAICAVQRMSVEPFVTLLSQDVVHLKLLLIFFKEDDNRYTQFITAQTKFSNKLVNDCQERKAHYQESTLQKRTTALDLSHHWMSPKEY